MLRVLHTITIIVICQSLIFTPLVFSAELSLPAEDIIAPVINYEHEAGPISFGNALQIKLLLF